MKTILVSIALVCIVVFSAVAVLIDAIPYLAMPASSTWKTVISQSPNVYIIPTTDGPATSYNTELYNIKVGPVYLIAHRITFIDNIDDVQVIALSVYEYDDSGNVTGSRTLPYNKTIKPERMAMP